MIDPVCPFCGEPVDPTDGYTWHRVEAWERKSRDPERRHGSDIALRQQVDGFAHGHCVQLAQTGLLNQTRLSV